eukprot:TRINITY_DN53456_c0_g1_i1.p1 TRINITY_DN53456_c0_g1~~TRINITY_DN53456_c0_g1_i1.p1  ORF type:complete len:717 (+),score=146.58 TRINITY_DN53456_c0_g1_i1:21-2171(+)
MSWLIWDACCCRDDDASLLVTVDATEDGKSHAPGAADAKQSGAANIAKAATQDETITGAAKPATASSAKAALSVSTEAPGTDKLLDIQSQVSSAVNSKAVSDFNAHAPTAKYPTRQGAQDETESDVASQASGTSSQSLTDDAYSEGANSASLPDFAGPANPGGKKKKKEKDKTKPALRKSKSVMSNVDDPGDKTQISTSLGINIDNPGNVLDFYTIHKKLGAGCFGTVCKATVTATGALRAIKKILIPKGKDRKNVDFLKQELKISKMMDHPNIVKLFEVFEDASHLYLVLELCRDGDVSKHVPEGGLGELDAASLFQQLLCGVQYMHMQQVVHRDLKSENLLLSMKNVTPAAAPKKHGVVAKFFKSEKLPASQYDCGLRITDFGLSTTCEPGEFLRQSCGTASHKAPQVYAHHYTNKADLWACGVILYFMLSRRLPFDGGSEEAIKAKVMAGKFTWTDEWSKRSADAMKCVRQMLTIEEDKRPAASQVLKTPWLKKQVAAKKIKDLDADILDRLRGFRKLNKFKKVALTVIVSMLTENNIAGGRELFAQLDKDGDGFVNVGELREALEVMKIKKQLIEQDTNAIFHEEKNSSSKALRSLRKRPSFDEDSKLHAFTYTEFLAATFDRQKCTTEAVCRAAFCCFDKDRSGNLDQEELLDGRLLGELTMQEVNQLVRELDVNEDGELNFDEFFSLMTQNTEGVKALWSHVSGYGSSIG